MSYKECAEDIYKLFEVQDKIARGLVVQLWYISISENILNKTLSTINHAILSKNENGYKTYIEIEFQNESDSKHFTETLPKNSNFNILSETMMMNQKIVPKPTLEQVYNRKEFVVNENCSHLCK